MTDTRKEYEEWLNNCPLTLFGGEFQVSELAWQACQSLNDKRIEQLLAVIAKKDESLHSLIGWKSSSIRRSVANSALAIKPENVELVEVGKVKEVGGSLFACQYSPDNGVRIGDILLTIKTKASTK